ncbi:uncharacterized protein LOC130723502 [Lotus japonicus]|uniref:uncharacterized protein LOC130723485 n=1 Tax=Lotus japonicus TaxID=34305 RepID=UPI0025897963|nr:uncharacterized protein LOC130723485 [Lotus japonicus]XP_057430561.1 uncharacterized protein LOC130723502 [Lotus japonicus]
MRAPGVWNREMVEFIFCPSTATQILALPIPLHGGEDVLFWPGSVDGFYTAKLGYDFVSSMTAANTAGSSSSTPPLGNSLWKKLWSRYGLPRCKEFSWRICRSFVPVRSALARRGMAVDLICPLCGIEEETIKHLWLCCPASRSVFFAIPLALRLERFVSLPDFLHQFLAVASADAIAEWQTAAYVLWEARNKLVFEGRPFSCDAVVRRTLQLVQRPSSAQVSRQPGIVLETVWRRPEEGMIKVNVDASFKSATDSGSGLIARDSEGQVLAAAASYPVVASSPVLAEAWALRWAIILALELGFRRVCFETDCLLLFQRWQKPPDGVSYLMSILRECLSFRRFFDVMTLSFVRRSGNSVADLLARRASTYAGLVWVEEVPSEALPFVSADYLAFMPVQV